MFAWFGDLLVFLLILRACLNYRLFRDLVSFFYAFA